MRNITWTFAGKTVVVTGASRGIGLAAANLFADAGARVYGFSRTWPPEGLHTDVNTITGSVTDAAAVSTAMGVAAEANGRIDICVANAGAVLVEDFADTDPDIWSALFDTNVIGVMRTWQEALPYMTHDGGGGRLIATSSAAGVRAEREIPTYSASKAAISCLVQALALEYAAQKITVNAVAPGEIETALNREAREGVALRSGRSAEDVTQHLVSQGIPMGRIGEPTEIADLIAFLSSSEAGYVTGQTILMDGGQLLI